MQSVCAFGRGVHTAPRPLGPRAQRRQVVRVCANLCPYSTLGVNSTASDTEIKQAYRKLVLQYHPDVNSGPNADIKFMSIQQAYELLTGKSRGPQGADGRRTDWAFHDWFWSFTQKRRWGSYKKGTAGAAAAAAADAAGAAFGGEPVTPPHKQPEHQATLRSQLAGLRHRAAIRARKQRSRPAASSNDAPADVVQSDSSEPEGQAGPGLEYDSTEMSDGCNMASGITDWEAAEAAAAARRFSATESHKQQVMQQMAGLHRRAAVNQEANVW